MIARSPRSYDGRQESSEAALRLATYRNTWPEPRAGRLMWQWRIARAIAIASGLAAPDEGLRERVDFSRVFEPLPASNTSLGRELTGRLRPLRDVCESATPPPLLPGPNGPLLPWLRAAIVAVELLRSSDGHFLLDPPKIGADVREARMTREMHSLDWLNSIISALSDDRHDQGAITLMLEQERDAWCATPEELLAVEDLILVGARQQISRNGFDSAVNALRSKPTAANYLPPEEPTIVLAAPGLVRWEAECVVSAARQDLQRYHEIDVATARSLLLARIDDFCKRARKALDLRAELQGIKLIALIQGLGRTEPEDSMAIFAQVARRLPANTQLRLEAGSNSNSQLPAIDVTATVVPATSEVPYP